MRKVLAADYGIAPFPRCCEKTLAICQVSRNGNQEATKLPPRGVKGCAMKKKKDCV